MSWEHQEETSILACVVVKSLRLPSGFQYLIATGYSDAVGPVSAESSLLLHSGWERGLGIPCLRRGGEERGG